MKYYLLLLFALGSTIINAQVGIDTTNPDASSALDIQSTTAGVLVPRMTQTQRIAITTSAIGLLVCQNDNSKGFYYYDGITWLNLSTSSGELPAFFLFIPKNNCFNTKIIY